jgi:hypothetical protein
MYLTVCTVDAVDEEARTIDCTPIDEGAQLLGVNLQANQSEKVGIVSLPAVGSEVVVGFINPAVAVAVLTMEVTKTILTIGDTEITVADNAVSLVTKKVKADISGDTLKFDVNGTTLEMDGNKTVWNGGSETTANATNLKQELTKMSARIDGIIQAITTSVVAPMDGGATYKANMAAVVSALQKENFSQMIDDKIKH